MPKRTGQRPDAHFTDEDWFNIAVKGIRAACQRGGGGTTG
jgi:hypothetical protein